VIETDGGCLRHRQCVLRFVVEPAHCTRHRGQLSAAAGFRLRLVGPPP
jgi:hypothetical protein